MAATKVTAEIQRITPGLVEVEITGTSPLIVNQFSEKARLMMEKAQQGERVPKEPKRPEELFKGAMYLLPDGRHGFIARGFKGAMVSAGRFFNGITMTSLRQSVFVRGEGPDQLVPLIIDDEPIMRQDPVRNATGVADLRYRPMYEKWGAKLLIEFVPSVLSVDSVVSLVDAAGIGGVGEWRPTAPKSNGDYGRFAVVPGGISIITSDASEKVAA